MITLNECVQKQRAMPVKATKDCFMVVYRCPRCINGLAFRVGTEIVGNQNKYCGDCGQKLDWRKI